MEREDVEGANPEPSGGAFWSTIFYGASTILNIAVGVGVVKGWALCVGPEGFGRAALLQGWAAFFGILAGFGFPGGLLRVGPELVAQGRISEWEGSVRNAWKAWGLACGAAAILAVAAARALRHWIDLSWYETVIIVVTLALISATGIQNAVVMVHRRRWIQWATPWTGSLAAGAASLVVLARWGSHAVPTAVLVQYAVLWAASRAGYALTRQSTSIGPLPEERHRELIRISGSFALSTLVGGGVQHILPWIVAASLDTTATGHFRAAAVVAINYVAVLLSGLTQDYQTKVASVRQDKPAIVRAIAAQWNASVPLMGALAAACILLSEWVLKVAYSPAFIPAMSALDWMMLGSVPKVAAWCLAYPLLTTASGRVVVLVEGATGAAWLASSWIAVSLHGVTGMGLAFAATQTLYLLFVWAFLAREGVRPGREQGAWLLASVAVPGLALAWKIA